MFTIEDSFGDGICCNEGQGKYTISINDSEVSSGGEFGFNEIITYNLNQCNEDSECDDLDDCTDDKCIEMHVFILYCHVIYAAR